MLSSFLRAPKPIDWVDDCWRRLRLAPGEPFMSCCDETTARVPPTDVSRRSILKGAAVITALVPATSRSEAQGRSVKLAYCSQLLCGVPYEVARAGGHFKNHGLNVELRYTPGGSASTPARLSAASQSRVGCLCLPLSRRQRPLAPSQPSRRSKARPSASRLSAMPIMR